jgi:hypothetical protein
MDVKTEGRKSHDTVSLSKVHAEKLYNHQGLYFFPTLDINKYKLTRTASAALKGQLHEIFEPRCFT